MKLNIITQDKRTWELTKKLEIAYNIKFGKKISVNKFFFFFRRKGAMNYVKKTTNIILKKCWNYN